MLVPHGSGSSRAVEVSQTVVKALVGIGGVVALLVTVALAASYAPARRATRDSRSTSTGRGSGTPPRPLE